MYVQVIPLYLQDDEAARAYFEKYRDVIDAVTGVALVVFWAAQVKEGDAGAVVAALGNGRFKEVSVADLPCLLIETSQGSLTLPLGYDETRLKSILRTLTAVAQSATTIDELKEMMMNALTPQPSPPQVPKWFAVAGFACIAVFIAFLMWLIGSDHQIPRDNRMLVVFLLAITLAAGLGFIGGNAIAKGTLPLPFVKNNPIQFTMVGGGAIFVIALLVGYYTYVRLPA